MVWNVYVHDFNGEEIKTFNVFHHGRFNEDVKNLLKKCNDKEEFKQELKRIVMYYYWSKCEWEVIVTSFPMHIEKDELNRLNIEFKNDTEKYGQEPRCLWASPDVGEKVDVFSQLSLNWDIFVDYVWSYKGGKKNGLTK